MGLHRAGRSGHFTPQVHPPSTPRTSSHLRFAALPNMGCCLRASTADALNARAPRINVISSIGMRSPVSFTHSPLAASASAASAMHAAPDAHTGASRPAPHAVSAAGPQLAV